MSMFMSVFMSLFMLISTSVPISVSVVPSNTQFRWSSGSTVCSRGSAVRVRGSKSSQRNRVIPTSAVSLHVRVYFQVSVQYPGPCTCPFQNPCPLPMSVTASMFIFNFIFIFMSMFIFIFMFMLMFMFVHATWARSRGSSMEIDSCVGMDMKHGQ